MQIEFEREYLSTLYHTRTADKKHWFQPEVIKKYIKVVNILKQAKAVEDLFPFNSLNYEKLSGDKVGVEAVRVTGKYRLEFQTETNGDKTKITICRLQELSNHYK